MKDVENMPSEKSGVVSVRLTPKVYEEFSKVCGLLQLNKADFLRGCIEKLCYENEIILKHHDKTEEYIEFIKNEFSKLPRDKIEVENGSWDTVEDVSIFIFFVELWSSSEKVWNCWYDTFGDYEFFDEEGEEVKGFRESHLFDPIDIGLLLVKRKTGIDIPDLLEADIWCDTIENKKISLVMAVKNAIEKFSAEDVLNDSLKRISREFGAPVKAIVNAKGEFKRTGDFLLSPVKFEPLAGET